MSNKKKIVLVVVIILLSIGFAAVAVNLRINGNVMVKGNASNFDVIYDTTYYEGKGIAVVNGLQYTVDNPSYTNNTSMTFNPSKGLLAVGDYYEVSYKILNNSTLYGALVNIECGSNSDGTGDLSPFTYSGDTYNIQISPQGNKEGKIRFTYATEQETNTNLSFTCKVVAEALSTDVNGTMIDKDIYLYDLVKNQYVGDEDNSSVIFSTDSASNGTNGVYMTTSTDSGNAVYYYRGSYSKLKNNIIFNNMCWKIVRTTETGGTKLIYNGTPTDNKCDSQEGVGVNIGYSKFNENAAIYSEDNAYAGYMYGTVGATTVADTNANINDSIIKTVVDNWYSANFTDSTVTSKIEDTIYCNDRSVDLGNDYGSNYVKFKSDIRLFENGGTGPTLKCANDNDKFTVSSLNGNGALTYPVGLITADETVYAGFDTLDFTMGSKVIEDTTNYLYSKNRYWTMTPVFTHYTYHITLNAYVDSSGYVADDFIDSSYGVRPVISLKNTVRVLLEGDGSTTNPYVVR